MYKFTYLIETVIALMYLGAIIAIIVAMIRRKKKLNKQQNARAEFDAIYKDLEEHLKEDLK